MKKQLETIKDEELLVLGADFLKTLIDLNIMDPMTETVETTFEAYQEKIELAKRHPFWIRVNNVVEFENAKKAFFEKTVVEEPITLRFCLQHVSLEFFCANAIQHICNPNLIKQATVPQKTIDSVRQAARQLEYKLRTNDGFYFESRTKQHALRAILGDLLSSEKESPYNTGKLHNLMMREAFAKYLLTQLLRYCDGLGLSPTFLADRIISIVSTFFDPKLGEMDRSDWISHAQTLDLYWRTEQRFSDMTFSQYLNDSFTEAP